MPESILVLQLEGPMQSWGSRSRWDVRDTGLEPTKSGVIGLLGCAMGLKRGSARLEELDKRLRFGVRIDRPGVISTDFHTVSGYHRTAAGEFKHGGGTSKSLAKAQEHDESTVVSQRDYLHDAAFLVALEGPSDLVAEIILALLSPAWPLFLGRKSCVPSRAIVPRTSAHPTIESTLRKEAWLAPRHHGGRANASKSPPTLSAYIEDKLGELVRQDALRINSLRSYEFRNCRYLTVRTEEEAIAWWIA